MCWDCNYNDKGDPYKNFRHNGVEVDDFEDEVPYRRPPRRKKKDKAKTRPGCPENEFKAHVYVWTTETEYRDFFYDYFGFPKSQSKVCVGCGKRNGTKPSDEYMKRKERAWAKLATPEKGVPVSRWRYRNNRYVAFNWWLWENEIEDYRKARREYIDRNGWPKYLYGF